MVGRWHVSIYLLQSCFQEWGSLTFRWFELIWQIEDIWAEKSISTATAQWKWSGLETLETGHCHSPLRWCWVTPKSFFQKMLSWSSSDCYCLRQFVKATRAYRDTWGEYIEIKSGREARESFRIYWKKGWWHVAVWFLDVSWCFLKREWHGLTSSVSRLDEHLYFASRCLRTSKIMIEQDLERTRMGLSHTIMYYLYPRWNFQDKKLGLGASTKHIFHTICFSPMVLGTGICSKRCLCWPWC